MKRIILHIGPEKCGSTTVQKAITDPHGPFSDHVRGIVLDPYEVHALGTKEPSFDLLERFHRLIETEQAAHPDKVLVLSHEMVFKSAEILTNLARISRSHTDELCGIAYVRRQSDFLVSGFGQWYFRSKDRLSEAADALRKRGLDPTLFWSIERHIMACLLENWRVGRQQSGHLYIDWRDSVRSCAEILTNLGGRLEIGLLPRKGFEGSILPDFAMRAGLGVEISGAQTSRDNPSFHPFLIEAVSNAIEAGYEMPGPSEANNFFAHSSSEIKADAPEMPFLDRLKCCVDTCFLASNRQFSEDWGLPKTYFEPEQHIGFEDMLVEIQQEAALRASLPDNTRILERSARAEMAHLSWVWFQKCA